MEKNGTNNIQKIKSQPFGAAKELSEWLHEIALCICCLTLVFVFLIRLVSVSGSSMYPTLNNGDKVLLISNFIDSNYNQGDIVVLQQTDYKDDPLIKRVIATEGQTVDIDFQSGEVTVDGIVLYEIYINELTHNAGDQTYPLVVPENCVFVMGDNRNASADSRYSQIGTIDIRQITGRVLLVVFPFKNFGTPEMGCWSR